MDTKVTLEGTCRRLESRYQVPEDFKDRIRRILEPLFRHVLDADEMVAVERALERTYMRHAVAEAPATPTSVAEQLLAEGADSVQPLRRPAADAAASPAVPAAPAAQPVSTAVPASGGRKGGLLLVKIDPKTKTAQLIRLSPDEVKVLADKAALGDFLKSSDAEDDDSVVH